MTPPWMPNPECARLAAVVACALGLAACALPAARTSPPAAALAAERGCDGCHAANAPPMGAPMPVAPAWAEIADRYRRKPGAEEALAAAVFGGTDERHWKGSPFLAMLPNEKVLTVEEARTLVRWILAQPPVRGQ